MVSVHTSSPPTVHTAYLRCLCDCSKCDSSGFDLDSRNSSWSIARLKEYLRKKEDTVVCCSRKPSLLNAKYLSIVISHTHCVSCTPAVLFQVQPDHETNKQKESLLAQTSPALKPLPLPFCQLPIVSGLSIWPRRRRGQT